MYGMCTAGVFDAEFTPVERFSPGMVKQVKGGYLLRHKKRLFGKAWREEWVVLYEDSTLAWFKEKGRVEPEGSLLVKDAPELLAVSHWTLRIPGRPDLPGHCHVTQVMAFGTRRREKVHWFLAQSEEEVNDWMTAISNTLPPPPQPPKPPDEKSTIAASMKPGEEPASGPQDARLPPTIPYYASIPGEVPPAYATVTDGQQNGYARAPQQQQQQPTTPNGTPSTIVVRDRGGGGIGDLTTGVMMGATLTNWGHGWGWGGGWGWGSGSHHDLHISNHYDINNTHILNGMSNNELSHYVDDDFGDFDDADYGMDCSGDFGF